MSDYRCGFCRQSLATVKAVDRFIFLAVPDKFTIALGNAFGNGNKLPAALPAGSTWLCSKADCLLSAFVEWRHKIRGGAQLAGAIKTPTR